MFAGTPLVRRAVRTGGLFLAVAAVQFVVVALIVESHAPGSNLWTASVASLGSSAWPWGPAFNASVIALGVLAVLGLLFSWSAFDERPSRGVGLFALLVSGGAAICVGAFSLLASHLPTNSVTVASYVAIAAAAVGFLVVASAMHRHERWRVSRAYTFATGLVVLGGLVLFFVHLFGFTPGVLERVAVAAALLWSVIEGLHIALLHRFAPGLQVKVATA